MRGASEVDRRTAMGGRRPARSLTADGWGEHLAGAVDEVRSYTGVLTDSDISRVCSLGEYPNL